MDPVSHYELNTSYQSVDTDWDDFLRGITGNHHLQSSLWAQVNECLGWNAGRVVAKQNMRIVAGAQVLFKPLSNHAAIGYVPNGPVFTIDDLQLREALLTELSRLGESNCIRFLVIQPPMTAEGWLNELPKFGFQPSMVKMGPTATILVDLRLGLGSIFGQMKARTRYNIRLSNRKGVSIRSGAARDLERYYELVQNTSQRQRFSTYPEQYFRKMWEVFEPRGHIKLFLSEYLGKIVSGQLVIAFGNMVVNKLSVWSGEHGDLKPNESLQWHAICWGKENGYCYFDLEGIDFHAASAISRKEPIPEVLQQSVTSFKLGFGGRVVLLPGVYDHIYDRAMRLFYDKTLMKMEAFRMDGTLQL